MVGEVWQMRTRLVAINGLRQYEVWIDDKPTGWFVVAMNDRSWKVAYETPGGAAYLDQTFSTRGEAQEIAIAIASAEADNQ